MPNLPDFPKLLEGLPEPIASRLRQWLPRTQRLSVARARLAALRGRLRLDSISTGTWRGTDISGEEIRIDMKADAVAFEDSRVELHVNVELDFQVPSIRSRLPKVFKLGPVHESVATPTLPRIDLAGVARELAASFVLSSVRADEVTADVAPILDVDAGDAEVVDVQLREIAAPATGLGLAGVRAGGVQARCLGLEGARALHSNVAVARVAPHARASGVVLRGATISGGRAVAAEGDALNLGFEVQLPAMTIKTFPAMPAAIERLVTRLSVRIEPKVVFQIGNLRLEGLSLATRVGSLRIGELLLPVEVSGVHLDQVELDEVGLENVELADQEQDPPSVAPGSADPPESGELDPP